MKKLFLVIIFLAISGVIIWKAFQSRSGYEINDHKEKMPKVDSELEVNLDKLAAYDVAANFVKRSLREPMSAEFPGRKRLDHVTSLGNNRYSIDSWVDSQDTYGAMRRRGFTCIVEMDKTSVSQESFEIEEIGHIPEDD